MKHLFLLLISTLYIYANAAFVDYEYLKENIDNKNLVLIDTTDLQTFKEGHIKNAIQADISLFRHKVDNTYSLMNSSKVVEESARALGINNDSEVIIYGHHKDKELLKSSYIALALITNGFKHVSLLNGGYGAFEDEYEDEEGAISTAIPSVKRGNFTAVFNKNIIIYMKYVAKRINTVPMLEARPKAYFTGERKSNGVKRLGHIPGAQSSFWREKLELDDTVKSDKKLAKIFFDTHKLDKNKEVIAYCTGGLEASMNWYILKQHMHFKNVKIYDASMKQWGNLDSTPMQK